MRSILRIQIRQKILDCGEVLEVADPRLANSRDPGLGISQEELANLMGVQQPAISKLVRRSDMKVSTLRDLISTMGGELHITATFPDRSVEIWNFTGSAA